MDRIEAILNQLQMGPDLRADNVTACRLGENVVDGDGDILGAEHLVLVDEILCSDGFSSTMSLPVSARFN